MSDLTVFYVLDLSASMQGEKLDILNHAIEECNDTLSELAKEKNADLKIAMMTFSENCDWMTPHGPESIDDFAINYFQCSNEVSNLGVALYELNNKLYDRDFYNLTTNDYFPLIIFITDGEITDDYISAIECCKANKLYEKSTKIAINISDDSDLEILSRIVENK